MQVIFRTNKKKIQTGEMIRKNKKTVVVRLGTGKVIKRHMEKHYVRIHPKDREAFMQLKSVRENHSRFEPMLQPLPEGY